MICTSEEPLDPRVRRTRTLLQDALRSLVHEKQFSAISVQDIAERATVNRATFYAHYKDKEDLVINVFKADFHAALIQRFAERPALTHDSLVEIAMGVFEFLEKMHDACPETAAELQDTVGKAVQKELYILIDRMLSSGKAYLRLFPGCTKETVATVLSWSIYGGAIRWSSGKQRVPVRQICQELVSILIPQPNTSVQKTPVSNGAKV